jgi:tRNA threonylcarbamoyladenosine biosynthesis protein TsaB
MNDLKSILAIETSEQLCGVCIYFSYEKFYSTTINLKHSHSEKIFEAIEWLFKNSGIAPSDLDSIAVSEGPGSFTGLRIGMSAAKGIAYGAGLPIIPVPTFEALALQLSTVLDEGSEFIIANKVNKDEVYYAKFQIKGNNYIFGEELMLIKNSVFVEKANGFSVFGNANYLLGKEVNYLAAPDPYYIAKWAVKYGANRKIFNYDFLEPNYLKNFIVKERKI